MIKYLKLIRYQNLAFIVFIQLMMRQTILMPILQKYGFNIPAFDIASILLIIATVFIAGGGYILNDYFDIKIDAINRPEKQIVNNTVPKRTAMLLHQLFTATGVILGLISAYFSRSFTMAFIFIVVPGLLWFYSASYKRQFITGNLIVAFVAALSVMIVAINELALLKLEFGDLIYETQIPTEFYGWVGGFSLFSFLLTWIRELIKDIEDIKGDMELECRTMPIKWGIAKTKWFIYTLIIVTTATLFTLNHLFISFDGSLTTRYIAFGIGLPLITLLVLVFAAKTSRDFSQASTLSKFIMLTGVLYGFIFYYLMAKTYNISLFDLFLLNK